MPRNVLVVSTSEHSQAELRAALGAGVDRLLVVTPVVELSRLQWLANDEDAAREKAARVASDTAESLPGRVVDARAGDSDPATAVEDALRTFAADEIVVVTRPDEQASWLESIGTPDSLHGVPLRRLELP